MRIPLISKTTQIDINFLRRSFKESAKIYNEIVSSAHSKTLEELYTDEFKPKNTKSCITTVKSLFSGKPVEAKLNEMMLTGLSFKKNHRLKFSLIINKINELGYKSFGILVNKTKTNKFLPGRMESYQNEEFAGVQIRLLQAAIEYAKRYSIKSMPLTSLLPALKFHTMMGFRPIRTFDFEIRNQQDFKKAIEKCYYKISDGELYLRDIIPIISKTNGKYYLDVNRTIYCSMMKYNEKTAKTKGLKALKIYDRDPLSMVVMNLQGREFNKWLERIKGFEMIPDNGFSDPKFGIYEKFIRRWFSIIFG